MQWELVTGVGFLGAKGCGNTMDARAKTSEPCDHAKKAITIAPTGSRYGTSKLYALFIHTYLQPQHIRTEANQKEQASISHAYKKEGKGPRFKQTPRANVNFYRRQLSLSPLTTS